VHPAAQWMPREASTRRPFPVSVFTRSLGKMVHQPPLAAALCD
jgi:hypothetical protein